MWQVATAELETFIVHDHDKNKESQFRFLLLLYNFLLSLILGFPASTMASVLGLSLAMAVQQPWIKV